MAKRPTLNIWVNPMEQCQLIKKSQFLKIEKKGTCFKTQDSSPSFLHSTLSSSSHSTLQPSLIFFPKIENLWNIIITTHANLCLCFVLLFPLFHPYHDSLQPHIHGYYSHSLPSSRLFSGSLVVGQNRIDETTLTYWSN